MGYDEFATNNPIGAGPFQFENWAQGEKASVTKFEDYHGDVALLDGINWATIEDANAEYNYAMNKNADIFGIPTSFYDQGKVSVEETDDLGRDVGTYGPLRNDDTANYLGVPSVNSFYLGFNMANVEKPIRQAFAYMVNQQQTADQIFKGRVAPGYHFTPPNIYPDGPEAYDTHAEENYPYGYNESLPQEAVSVMEEAGYGPNNRASVTYTHYASSDTFAQYGQILRDQLGQAYIDVSIEAAQFSTLIQRVRSGNMQVYTLGWIADWPAPDNFLQLLNPPQTDTSEPDPISGINWSSETGSAAEQAASAYETVTNNLEPTDEAQQTRNEAYVQIEEANWEDVGFLNLYHRTDERFWYDAVDVPRFGGMGTSRQKHNHTSKQQ
jgi:peptide/nickel transport system substrate-binding protein